MCVHTVFCKSLEHLRGIQISDWPLREENSTSLKWWYNCSHSSLARCQIQNNIIIHMNVERPAKHYLYMYAYMYVALYLCNEDSELAGLPEATGTSLLWSSGIDIGPDTVELKLVGNTSLSTLDELMVLLRGGRVCARTSSGSPVLTALSRLEKSLSMCSVLP